jgi:hypothetical protein
MIYWTADGPVTKCAADNILKQKTCDRYIEGDKRECCCNLRDHGDWNQCISEKKP